MRKHYLSIQYPESALGYDIVKFEFESSIPLARFTNIVREVEAEIDGMEFEYIEKYTTELCEMIVKRLGGIWYWISVSCEIEVRNS